MPVPWMGKNGEYREAEYLTGPKNEYFYSPAAQAMRGQYLQAYADAHPPAGGNAPEGFYRPQGRVRIPTFSGRHIPRKDRLARLWRRFTSWAEQPSTKPFLKPEMW